MFKFDFGFNPVKPQPFGFRWTSLFVAELFLFFLFHPIMNLGIAPIFVEKNQNRSGALPEAKKGDENIHRVEQDAT